MRVQIADTGKVLTNGDTYSERVYLGDGAAPWAEVNPPEDGEDTYLEELESELIDLETQIENGNY